MVQMKFPYEYEGALQVKAYEAIQKAEKCAEANKKEIAGRVGNKVDVGNFGCLSGVLGGVCGLVSCSKGNGSFGSWLVWIIFGAVCGAVLGFLINSIRDSEKETAKQMAENEDAQCKKKSDDIRAQVKDEAAKYEEKFDAMVQRLSVEYAESTLVTEVVKWMTAGLTQTIDAADRRSHVQQIDIPFSFRVYNNRITCNLGT